MPIDRNLANSVFIRDGWKCRQCGHTDGLHPHHVVFKSQGGKDELYNLITLCYQCHRALHDGFLKVDILSVLADNVLIKFTKVRGWIPR